MSTRTGDTKGQVTDPNRNLAKFIDFESVGILLALWNLVVSCWRRENCNSPSWSAIIYYSALWYPEYCVRQKCEGETCFRCPPFLFFGEAISFAVFMLEVWEDTGVGHCAVRFPQMHHVVGPQKSLLGKINVAGRQTFLASGDKPIDAFFLQAVHGAAISIGHHGCVLQPILGERALEHYQGCLYLHASCTTVNVSLTLMVCQPIFVALIWSFGSDGAT